MTGRSATYGVATAAHCPVSASLTVPLRCTAYASAGQGGPMTSEEKPPAGVDITRPSIARVYGYVLGGKDNFAIDRMASQRALEITPDGPEAARASRAFLRRVVHYLAAEAGIRQFLDLGS